jgi:radical SAM protein
MSTALHAPAGRHMKIPAVDFSLAPFLVIWETTQACALACRHCRASARPWRDPRELTTEEGRRMVDMVADMGTPIMIFSGGDPVSRPDLPDLIRHAKSRNLRAATIPAATAALTRDLVFQLKEAGADQVALSLDFPDAAGHDAFRGVEGAFAKTMEAVGWAHEAGLPLQINTTLCGMNADRLPEMAAFVDTLGIVFWEVFFLVPMGRGELLGGLTAAQCEKLFDVLYRAQSTSSYVLKVTEAPHYRRHVALRQGGGRPQAGAPLAAMPAMLTRSEGPGHTIGLAPRGVNAGNGFLFVSHVGEICPSGFLPLPAGNVRQTTLADAYRNHAMFRTLRDPDQLSGRCGRCEFRSICGGSRARAMALTGDAFATDPWCSYEPRGTAC